MSCPKTRHLLTEYFDDNLSAVTREQIERHIESCEYCRSELADLSSIQARLSEWEEQRAPHWDRGIAVFRQAHRQGPDTRRNRLWQWLPTGISFAMLVLLLLNTSVTSTANGFTVNFGVNDAGMTQVQLDRQLTGFAAQQQQQQEQNLQLFMATLAERLDSNNLRLMQAVMEQTRELTADNFEQIYTYFEQQRQLDMETVQVSYQQLLDSDFETLQTMEQLANYVQFQGELR